MIFFVRHLQKKKLILLTDFTNLCYIFNMFYFEDFNGTKILKSDFIQDVTAYFTTRGEVCFPVSERIITPVQTHSDNIEVVDLKTEYPDTDGLILTNSNDTIYLKFADCTPLIFYDPVNKIGAVSHAGWRGTAAKIGVKTVEKMRVNFGTNPNNIIALIGPAIGLCCYEVSEEVRDKLLSTVQNSTDLYKEHNVDLKKINARQLEENGVNKIDICPYCTSCCNDLFYSYRKENGTDSPEYVFRLMDALEQTNIRRYMLPDTLGVLNPLQVIEFMRKMVKRYPHAHFDFHAHNDYDLAVSNVLAAVLSGCKGLHTTINGLGERAGNAPLASVQAILKDHFNAITNIDESRLNDVSRVVESYSGIVIPANKPIVGENVFTQVAGVHADGDNKSNLYCNDLLPERFGRKREYALGKNSGKANIRKNLEDLGLQLDEDAMRKVTERIIELGDKKELVTQEDLPYIVSDVLKHGMAEERVSLKSYIVNLAYGLKPMATLKIEINGKEYEESSSGDGQYDAFVRALRKIYKVTLGRKFPMLTNYAVTIPPGGRTDAFVQTVITWSFEDTIFRTRGLDADQTEAAIKATVKMLNIIEDEYES